MSLTNQLAGQYRKMEAYDTRYRLKLRKNDNQRFLFLEIIMTGIREIQTTYCI